MKMFGRICGLVLCLAFAAAPALAQTPESPAVPVAEDRADLFVITYRAGPAWQAGRPMSEQGLLSHGQYLRALLDEGRLYAAGPFLGADGGMVIVRAADRSEAEAILAADPAILGGIFVADIEHWWPRFRSDGPLPAPASPPPG